MKYVMFNNPTKCNYFTEKKPYKVLNTFDDGRLHYVEDDNQKQKCIAVDSLILSSHLNYNQPWVYCDKDGSAI